MCRAEDEHGGEESIADDAHHGPRPRREDQVGDEGSTRRRFLAAVGGGAAGLALSGRSTPEAAAAEAAAENLLAGGRVLRLAMHVHGSWSEDIGSWQAQFAEAASNGIDVLYMTDHDDRAMADRFIGSLAEARLVQTTAGQLAQQAATATDGALHLLAESGAPASAASVQLEVEPRPLVFTGCAPRSRATRSSTPSVRLGSPAARATN